jgi:two-component system LytT family response regulator
MLRAIIVDDELNGIKSLELLIKKFVPGLTIVASTTDATEGKDLINTLQPDIVFLDINMPVLNGFELLEALTHRNFYLVFTTAHQEYGLKAIKQSATDYLLKPIGEKDILDTVARVNQKIKAKLDAPDVKKLLGEIINLKNTKVPLPGKKTIEYVTPAEILYLEAESSSTRVVLTSLESVLAHKPMKEYEQILCRDGLHFIRIHNSYIINVNYVSRYLKEDGGYVVMPGRKTIPVSKQKKEEFLAAINFTSGA